MKRNLFKKSTLAAAVAIAALGLGAAGNAQAAATAYASIQLNNFSVGYWLDAAGASPAALGTDFTISSASLPRVTAASATWNGIGTNTSDSVAYNAQSNAPQATAGPGPFPGQNDWSLYAMKALPGVGARGDAYTSATAGGVVASVNNASEIVITDAYSASAQAASSNSNTYTVQVSVGDTPIWVNFNAPNSLFAYTAYSDTDDTAQGSITAQFTVTPVGSQTALYDYSPEELNDTCSSQDGANQNCGVATLTDFDMQSGMFQLAAGSSYLLNLYISSAANGTAVPEPASMALLGLGLVGLAATRRRFVRV